MSESDEITAEVKRLRLTYAINTFKHLLLDDLHVAGEDQSGSLFKKIRDLFSKEPLSERTWQNLFVKAARVTPQPGTINAMDEIGERFLHGPRQSSGREGPALNGYFSELVRGGLIREMTKQTKSKNAPDILISRANRYQPLTPLHLHFDAIEVAAWSDDLMGGPWESVTRIAAQRILDILAQRWGPRDGYLYAKFSSNLRLQWEAADAEERGRIQASLARWKPNLFEMQMKAGAHPNWSIVSCDADCAPAHIYKLLFALAADTEFLIADRLTAWALDLVTAALAMYALAWTNRYITMGVRIYDEKLFWIAFNKIYFDPEPLGPESHELLSAIERCQASWSTASLDRFMEARQCYLYLLSKGGISAQEVFQCAMNATERHPLVYYG